MGVSKAEKQTQGDAPCEIVELSCVLGILCILASQLRIFLKVLNECSCSLEQSRSRTMQMADYIVHENGLESTLDKKEWNEAHC